MDQVLKIKGAKEHNLKNIDVEIPKNKLVVFTGVSGSGKSSLAFDTIYAEGQRRYVESLSSYARQFLGVMGKPDVELIEGLSPAISIDQKTTSHNPRSTVGTITEIYDYLRLLFAKIGHPHCPVCGSEITGQSVEQITDSVLAMIQSDLATEKIVKFLILSPLVQGKKGEFSSLFTNLKAKGYLQVRLDKQVRGLDEDFHILKNNKHTIEAITDKVAIDKRLIKDKTAFGSLKSRLYDSIEQALLLSDGKCIISKISDNGFDIPKYPRELTDSLFSEKYACPKDNVQIPEIEPRTFSFNSPFGACPKCLGIGKNMEVDIDRIFAKELTIKEGGILPFANAFEHDTWFSRILATVAQKHSINLDVPIKKLSKKVMAIVISGTGNEIYKIDGENKKGKLTHIFEVFRGIKGELERRYKETVSDQIRFGIDRFMKEVVCDTCQGTRLKSASLGITVKDKNISELAGMNIAKTVAWLENLGGSLSEREQKISGLIIKEILTRLKFLSSVGLNYLTLSREAATLAGGEAQRIRLASQIGSGLTGVLYVLDEPTIGLHPRDNEMLIKTLKDLRDLGNTLLVVEHDKDMMLESDYLFDFGPGAGKGGGKIVSQGHPKEVLQDKNSITGPFLNGKKRVDLSSKIKGNPKKYIRLSGACEFNLKSITANIPLERLVAVTGISGSGKSTLVVETLYHAVKSELDPYYKTPSIKYHEIEGVNKNIDKVVLIDQSPIGRTPRSNPATYTKVFDDIRKLFCDTHDARMKGYKAGRFSFNVKGGRCEACEGQGQTKIEMQFMADIWVTCEECRGKRYNSQSLEVKYMGKDISDVLSMSVDEALLFFSNNSNITRKLRTMKEVGLGYIELGQSAPTLSGGEAQRVKLAAELTKSHRGKTLYILDEPTVGLHFLDLEKLLYALRALVDKGNSVVVIEHNLDVVRNSDWVIDLGPEGGEDGGQIIAQGTPTEIVQSRLSYTGKFLAKYS